ncbi:hypothetical protein [Nocardia sp. NBC_00511]|uniref:hypothetical protein n=1 Tax=Nocardia sp. NBC_00511 TaxID=2903591 RepID=UPI0030DE4826
MRKKLYAWGLALAGVAIVLGNAQSASAADEIGAANIHNPEPTTGSTAGSGDMLSSLLSSGSASSGFAGSGAGSIPHP